jgi:alpha-N-acetylglucosamine transferase
MYLLGAIKKYGEWDGDIVVIENGFKCPKGFWKVASKVVSIDEENYNWAKVNIFREEIIRGYDRILYLDQDCIIHLPIQPIFEQQGDFISDTDTKLVREDFLEETAEGQPINDFCRLEKEINMNAEAFCSGIMMFDSKIIPVDFIKKLVELREQYKYINNLNGIEGGMAEQSILNIWFCEKWFQFKRACFVGRKREDTIISHCTKWYAPWKDRKYQNYYNECLQHFKEL